MHVSAKTRQAGVRRVPFRMLAAVALIASLAYGVSALVVGPPMVVADGLCYNASAARLLNTGVYSYLSFDVNAVEQPNAFVTPGYALVLAAVYSALPHSGDSAQVLINAIPFVSALYFVCAVLAAMFIAGTGFLIGGQRLGWTAGIAAALYLPFGAEAMSGWPENIGLVFTAACMFLAVGLLRAEQGTAWRWMAGFAVVGGVTVLMRPVTSLWLLVPIAMWAVANKGIGRRSIALSAAGVGIVVLVLSPWVIRNYLVLDQFIPLTTHAATAWIDGMGGRVLSPAEEEVYSAAVARGNNGYMAVTFARVRAEWEQDALGFIAWKGEQAWRLVSTPWSSHENPRAPVSADVARVMPPGYRSLSLPAYDLWQSLIRSLHLVALVLASIGLLATRRDRSTWVLVSIPLYFLAVHTVMISWTRYFYPAMPAVLVLAAIGVLYLVDHLRGRRARRVQTGSGASVPPGRDEVRDVLGRLARSR